MTRLRAQRCRQHNGLAHRHARQSLQDGLHEKPISHIGRYRIAGQPHEPAAPDPTEGQRPTRLDGHTPEIELSVFGQHGTHPIGLPNRYPAADHQQIQRRGIRQPLTELRGIIRHRAQILQRDTGLPQECCEHGPVAVVQVAGRKGCARRAQLRPRGEEAHPHRTNHRHLGLAQRHQQCNMPRVDPAASGQSLGTCGQVLARKTHIGTGGERRAQRDPVRLGLYAFLRNDGIRTGREHGPGHDARAATR